MASKFEKYSKRLQKQQAKLMQNSGREKQLHLKFTKQQQPDGKLKTTVRFISGEKNEKYDTKGAIHKLVNQRYRLVGDVPKISNLQPKSFIGKSAINTAKAGKFLLKGTASILLAAENAEQKLDNYLEQRDIRKNQKILSNEQFQVRFTRQQTDGGKFNTKINLVRGENNYKLQNKGVIHKLVNQKYRLVGDAPSLTKKVDTVLNKWKPKTVSGMTAKGLVKTSRFALKGTANTALKTALAVDSGAVGTVNIAKNYTRRAAQEGILKYKRESDDDANKAVLNVSQIAFNAGKGIINHSRLKKQHKLHKARYSLQKYSSRDLKLSSKLTLKKNKRELKAKKAEIKINKITYMLDKSNDGSKDKYKVQKSTLKLEQKTLKNKRKQTKTELKFSKKSLRNLRGMYILSTPMPLVFRPAKYTAKQITASSYQKAINADQSNDFIKVIDNVKRHGLDKASQQLKPSKLIEKKQKKKSKLQKKRSKQNEKLQKQENKLKSKSEVRSTSSSKKKKKKQSKKSIADKIKQFLKNVYEKEVKWFFILLFIPLLILLIMIVLIFSGTSSTISQSGFVLGTFAAQDFDLSQAEEYYTKLGYDMNSKILKLQSNGVINENWKSILGSLGVNTTNMTDTPTEVIWGRSEKLNYDAVWDFDPWKLWSFLCAYNYDFSVDSSGINDVKFWKFTDQTKSLIREIFNEEYQFECFYDNTSHWEELYNYDYDGQFHWVTGSGIANGYGYVDFVSVPENIKKFSNGNRIYFNYNNGEILNYNDGYSSTGFYFQDQRYIVTDSSGAQINPFYQYDTSAYQYATSNGYGRQYIINNINIWMPKSYWSFTMNDGRSFQDVFCVEVAPSDVVVWKYGSNVSGYIGYCSTMEGKDLYYGEWGRDNWIDMCKEWGETNDGYYGYGFSSYYKRSVWVEDCRLYYNVKQKKTFDQVIEDKLKSMSDADERLQYYQFLVGGDGSSFYGNHQTYQNIFVGNNFREYMEIGNILNWFGYDMQNWNEQHCNIASSSGGSGLHRGVDVYYPSGYAIYSPLDCKIEKYDSNNHVVILQKNGVNYWYEGKSGNGKKRDTKIYITNITLNSGYSEGSTLKAGENFATASGNGKCMLGGETDISKTTNSNLPYEYVHLAAYIDTDGYGWDYVDPILLFY